MAIIEAYPELVTLTEFELYECDGVAKLPRPSAPHKRASRPAPDFTILFY